MKIEELGLSARAYHVLKEDRIDTVEQLREVLSNSYVKIVSMGLSVFNETQEKLAALPLTNGDRIRAMSDEELRAFLCALAQCGSCSFDTLWGCTLSEWLEQPAKEET